MKRFVTTSMWNVIVGILAIAMFAAVLNVASPANAAIVNVDWLGNGSASAYVGLGAAPDSAGNTTWNGIVTTGPDLNWYGGLLNSDGSVSGTGIQLGGLGSGYRFASGGLSLFDGYTSLHATLPPAPVDATFTGLDVSAKYDLYLYAAHAWFGSAARADFTVNGVTQSINGNIVTGSFVLGTNYVKFANQSCDPSTNLNVNFMGTGHPNAPMWSGVQLAEVPDITERLSRGHNILLQRGLQIQAITVPDLASDGGFDSARWAESNFTTAHVWSHRYPETMPAAPGIPWGLLQDNTWLYNDLSLLDYPYVPTLVSQQFGDEQSIEDPVELAALAAGMASWHVKHPHVITYTNQGGGQHTFAAMQNYMQVVQPDMLCADSYVFDGNRPGGSPTVLYSEVQKYRQLGLAGNDGTGNKPIPVGLITQSFLNTGGLNDHIVSESEIRLNQFIAWSFGHKFVDAFTYEWLEFAQGQGLDGAALFYGSGTDNPRPGFYQMAETNRQSLNLGPSLVRLISTDVRMIMGEHGLPSAPTPNVRPFGVAPWGSTVDDPIQSITATNLGGKNDGLRGDVVVGYFKPLDRSFTNPGHEDDIYFMIVNGLSDATGSAADCRQLIHMEFDFGASGIDSLLRLSRETGQVEEVALIHGIGSQYSLDLYLDGGTGDLFKFNNGGLFVIPEPGTACLLGFGFGILAIWRLRRRMSFSFHKERNTAIAEAIE